MAMASKEVPFGTYNAFDPFMVRLIGATETVSSTLSFGFYPDHRHIVMHQNRGTSLIAASVYCSKLLSSIFLIKISG